MSPAVAKTGNAIRKAATNAGNLQQQNQQRAAQGQPEQSGLDVWKYTGDAMRDRIDKGRMYEDPSKALDAGLKGDWHSSDASGMGAGMGQQWDKLSDDFLNMVGLGDDPKKNPEGVLQNVGAFFGVLTGLEQLLTMWVGMIPFPALPAARVLDLALGLPHGHAHPPTFGTPLPSLGPILPIPYVSGANTVVINGMPAARCGDMGIGVWCGGYVPIFEVFLGSANVWIEGARAARILCDVTTHCIFSKRPGPKDPPVGPFVGTIIVASSNVIIGGFPLPSLMSMAMGAAFKALFKGLGKAFKSIRNKLGKGGKHMDNGPCGPTGKPVLPVTGEMADEFVDFELQTPVPFVWRRYYYSSWNEADDRHGWGFRHEYQRELHRSNRGLVYVDPERKEVQFPVREPGSDGTASDGMLLRHIDGGRYEIREPGQPTMQFEFRRDEVVAPLKSLQLGKAMMVFRYESNGRLVEVDACGKRIRVEHDAMGHVTGLILQENEHKQVVSAYVYDVSGCLIQWTDALGHSERYEYDQQRRLTCHTTRLNFSFWHEYDELGRCVREWGEDGLYDVRLEYHPEEFYTIGRFADGSTKIYRYDQNGIITGLEDPVGGITQYVLNEEGKVAQEIDPSGNVTDWIYNDLGGNVGRRDPLGYVHPPIDVEPNPPNPLDYTLPSTPLEWEFGGLLRMRNSGRPLVDDPLLRELPASIVNEVAELLESHVNSGNGSLQAPASDASSGRSYDALGRMVAEEHPDGRIDRWKYDADGNVIEHRDADGSVYSSVYASWRNLRQEKNPNGSVTTYAYNLREYPTKITDAGGTVSEYIYDLKDRIIEVRRHDRVKERYYYDDADNMIAKTDGQDIPLISWEIGPGNLDTVRRLASGETHEFTYDENGRYLSACWGDQTATFEHDLFGRRFADQREGQGVTHEFDGHSISATHYFERFTVTYRRISDSQLEITDPTGAKYTFATSPLGLIVRTLPSGSRELCQYDSHGRCLRKIVMQSGDASEGWRREYTYSPAGDLQRVEDSRRGTTRYQYDAAHRLTHEVLPDGSIHRFSHDAADNLVSQPGLEGVSLQEGNRVAEANGDQIVYNERNSISERRGRSGDIRYEYNALDALVSCDINGKHWEGEYDPLRRRTKKTWEGSTTEYYWDHFRLAGEVRNDGSLRLYIYAHPRSLVPFMFVEYANLDADAESGTCYDIFTNQIGTPTDVEDVRGRRVWGARIDPFGRAHVEPDSVVEMPLRFPGHYHDAEIDLHHNGFRCYSPELGRFIQSDPIGIAGGINLYGYSPNPLTDVDLDGLAKHANTKKPGDPKGESAGKKAVKIGDDVTDLAADVGMDPRHVKNLQKRAAQRGETIVVRKSNPDSLKWHDQPYNGKPCKPKPVEVKAKTAKAPDPHAGLAKADPPPPKGHTIDENGVLLDDQGRAMHGDYDLQGVYGPEGKSKPTNHPNHQKGMNNDLNKGVDPANRKDMVQHGANDNYKDPKTKKLKRSPEPDEEFLVVEPDGTAKKMDSPDELKDYYDGNDNVGDWPY